MAHEARVKPHEVRQWQVMEKKGLSRREIARRSGVTVQTVSKYLGKKGRIVDGNPRPEHKIYVHKEPYRVAREVARNLGYLITAGENTGQGNVALLIEAIGKGELTVLPTRAD